MNLSQCYRLEQHVKLQPGQPAAFIYATFPLFAIRTSPQIVEVLQHCDGQTSVAALAKQLKIKPGALLKVLEELHHRGFLQSVAIRPAEATSVKNWPSVSIVVPVYNRPLELKRCLEALFKLNYPSDKLEIIVVDDGSSDDTARVATDYPVRLLQNERQLGPAASRNRAIKAARYELIACVDSDCIVDPAWLGELVLLFDETAIAAVGGATQAFEPRTLVQEYEDSRSSLYMGPRPAEVRLQQSLCYLPTCNLVFRRAAFLEIGGFDPTLRFGEDVDFCWRLLKAGKRLYYQPAARLQHDYRPDWAGFLKTRLNYASSEAPLVARHADKRRTLYLPLRAVLAWLGLLTAVSTAKSWPLLLTLAIPLLTGLQKWRGLHSQYPGLPLSLWQVLVAEGRSQTIAGYHLSIHLGKYYSLPLLVGLGFRPTRLPVALGLVGPIVADYWRLKPRLNPVAFGVLGLLENFFYQLGLVRGCLRQGSLIALLPKIRGQWR